MLQLTRKQPSIIGLDIGTSMIKAAKMNRKGGRYFLESYAFERIQEGAIQSGEIKDQFSLAQSALSAVQKCDKNIKDVVIALPNYSMLSDVLTMDLLPQKEIRQAVLVEAERLSPFELGDVEIDFEVLDRNEEEKQMRVLMVAAKNDIIYSYYECMKEAGLKPVVVDVDLFALINIYQLNYEATQYRSSILINIGMDTTDAAFLQNGRYHSSRDIPVAGSNFENQLNMASGLPSGKIHDILNGKIDEDIDIDVVQKALNSVSKDFANAVGVAISYFQSSEAIDKVDLIVLSGGFAKIPGLINILELRTGAEVIVLNSFNNIDYNEEIMTGLDPEKIGTSLSVAMGLATRTH